MLAKTYDHRLHEQKLYQFWEEMGAFNPDRHPNSANQTQTFTIIMPPPNANDPLHLGHAMFVAVEDIMIRFQRMRGKDTLWLPGTDHAGIETQFVFEKKLQKEGKSRFDFDRQSIYQQIWDYVQTNSNVAVDQIKKLGASADWSRFKFTLDKDIVETVINTFKKLHNKGLIYRSNRLVNYCTHCGTGFSELEIDHQEQNTKLYYIKYGPLVVATTRPETKFADIALAVHPDDKRYHSYIGKVIDVPCLFTTYHLPVIADEFVDPKFGTGVVKITPYHDYNDFEFFERHQDNPLLKNVNLVVAVNHLGKLSKHAGPYQGLSVFTGRQKVVEGLIEKNLIEKIDEHYHNAINVCYRCGRAIEPLPLTQFYIKVKPLSLPVLDDIKQGKLNVIGAGHDKILKNWLENLKDWNISRQIVWGIRLPVWYDVRQNPSIRITFLNKDKQKITGTIQELLAIFSLEEIQQGLQQVAAPEQAIYEISADSPGKYYIQETDTFDTWFSSSQWPVATLQNTLPNDMARFYPTQVLETAYDILPFWVMRMLMMGRFITGELPFSSVYLHGLIRDSKGVKMSKSKGNVINPLSVVENYGSDALRMALVIRSSAGLDRSIGESDFKATRNLTNKLWNAARFVLLNLEEKKTQDISTQSFQKEYQQQLAQIVKEITNHLEENRLGLAADSLHNHFWHWYCDQIIEKAKSNQLSPTDLLDGLIVFLKLFHPFMPFVTEAIWQALVSKSLVAQKALILSSWPSGNF